MLGIVCASIKKKPISGRLVASIIVSAFCCFAITQHCHAENPEVYPGAAPLQVMPPCYNPFANSNKLTIELHNDAEKENWDNENAARRIEKFALRLNKDLEDGLIDDCDLDVIKKMYNEAFKYADSLSAETINILNQNGDSELDNKDLSFVLNRIALEADIISGIEALDFGDYNNKKLAGILRKILTWAEIYGCSGFKNKNGIEINVEKSINEISGIITATITSRKNSKKLVMHAEYEKVQGLRPGLNDIVLLIHSFEALGDGKDKLERKIMKNEKKPGAARREKNAGEEGLPRTKRTLSTQDVPESSEKRREWTGIKFESKDIIKDDAKITFKTGKINSNSWSTDDNILKELFVEGADDHGVENTQKEYETEDIQAQINEKAMLCVKTALGLMEREFYESIETINKAIPGAICVTENEPDGLVKRALIVFPLLDAEIDEAENKGKEGEGEV